MGSQLSNNKRIAKNTMALYIRMGITMLISFFTTRITLEILGFEDYGLNNVVASVVSMFGFINGSMGTAVQRFFSVEIGKNNGKNLSLTFGTGLYLHIIVALITLVIAEIFAIFFLSKLNIPQERLWAAHIVFQISFFSLFATIINVPFAALLRAHEKFSEIAIFDIIRALLKLGVLFLLYRINFDKIVALSALNFGVSLVYIVGITILAFRYKEVSFRIVRDKDLIKKMLNFISMLLFTVLASVLNKQGIVIVVNLFFGLTINAAYAVAFQVSRILETFAMNFKQSVVPQLMQAHSANDVSRMNKLIFMGTKVTFLLMMLISIPIIFETDYLLNFWLKDPPAHATVFTKLIIIGVNINTFYYFIYQAVHASGKIIKQQVLTSISYFLSIIVVYVSFKLGANFYYAAYVPIAFSVIRNIVVIYSATESIDFKAMEYISKVILPCLALVLVLTVASLLPRILMDSSLLRLSSILLINTSITAAFGYFLVLSRQERKSLSNLVMVRR